MSSSSVKRGSGWRREPCVSFCSGISRAGCGFDEIGLYEAFQAGLRQWVIPDRTPLPLSACTGRLAGACRQDDAGVIGRDGASRPGKMTWLRPDIKHIPEVDIDDMIARRSRRARARAR